MLPFGIGFSELVLIAIVVLLVVGPSRLPDLAKTVGKGVRTIRKASGDLRDAIDVDEVREIRRNFYQETRQAWDHATAPDPEPAAAATVTAPAPPPAEANTQPKVAEASPANPDDDDADDGRPIPRGPAQKSTHGPEAAG
jgi:sec-independent protein translocase protein TatB